MTKKILFSVLLLMFLFSINIVCADNETVQDYNTSFSITIDRCEGNLYLKLVSENYDFLHTLQINNCSQYKGVKQVENTYMRHIICDCSDDYLLNVSSDSTGTFDIVAQYYIQTFDDMDYSNPFFGNDTEKTNNVSLKECKNETKTNISTNKTKNNTNTICTPSNAPTREEIYKDSYKRVKRVDNIHLDNSQRNFINGTNTLLRILIIVFGVFGVLVVIFFFMVYGGSIFSREKEEEDYDDAPIQFENDVLDDIDFRDDDF